MFVAPIDAGELDHAGGALLEVIGEHGLHHVAPEYIHNKPYLLVLQKVPSEGSESRRRPLLGPSPG